VSPTRVQPVAQLDTARRRSLAPYVELLRISCEDHGDVADLEHPGEIVIGNKRLEIAPWEQRQIRASFGMRGSEPLAYSTLLTEAIALLAKCNADIQELAKATASSTDDYYARQAELMLDSSVGLLMVSEVGLIAERLRREDQEDQCRKLTQTLDRLRHSVAAVNRAIVESERCPVETDVEHPGEQVTAEPIDVGDVSRVDSPPASPLEPYDPAQIDRPVNGVQSLEQDSAPSGRSSRGNAEKAQTDVFQGAFSSRTTILLGALACTMAIWLLTFGLPGLVRGELRAISLEQLGRLELFEAVSARPPTLYIDVRVAEWGRLTADERQTVVQEVADVATSESYTGGLLRTAEGKPMATVRER
jgi:hypothetical protein